VRVEGPTAPFLSDGIPGLSISVLRNIHLLSYGEYAREVQTGLHDCGPVLQHSPINDDDEIAKYNKYLLTAPEKSQGVSVANR